MMLTKILKRQACTRRGDTIVAQPIMDIIFKKTKLRDSEKQGEGINCLLYEARNNVTLQEAEERTFKDT